MDIAALITLRRQRSGTGRLPAPVAFGHLPLAAGGGVVSAHGLLAVATLVLVLLTALGVGGG
jgi:hypothetical protein